MKIKIIDLLNKIANDEEVPKKIMFDAWLYIYDEEEKTYYDEEDRTLWQSYNFKILTDEVEIIEEPKKIEKIPLPSFDEFKRMSAEERYVITAKEYDLLDELIDEINNLKEK